MECFSKFPSFPPSTFPSVTAQSGVGQLGLKIKTQDSTLDSNRFLSKKKQTNNFTNYKNG